MLWCRFLSSNAPQQVNISHGNYQSIQQFLFPWTANKHGKYQPDMCQERFLRRMGAEQREGITEFLLDETESKLEERPAVATNPNSDATVMVPGPMPLVPIGSTPETDYHNTNESHSLHPTYVDSSNCDETQASQRRHSDTNLTNSQYSIKYFTNKKDIAIFDLYLNSAVREVSSLINGNLLTRFSESKYYQRYFVEKCSQSKPTEINSSKTARLTRHSISASSLLPSLHARHEKNQKKPWDFPLSKNQNIATRNQNDTNATHFDGNKYHRRFSLF
ncbi:hypothetical protein RFI_05751 [Reticulomyxa filosa]|uniref:RGS domain-containing protein n=1 Tax=Reticulomyxa filosa TaxID=46433 RepID=X6NZK8_RETFI|nr:hypothetical protein RFI_05751 [Reticulomyxa filosa]|eukprot:ETO31371.1 hypothetical protein RFI_05751 [Reticulomyxa filosa]